MYIGLPLEIWISVFEYLPRRTLRQTGLASKTLHIAACRLLYRSIRLTEQSPNLTATLELLEKNPSLARCIINAQLIFTGKLELQERWIAALQSWEHLERLEIHGFPSWILRQRRGFMKAVSALPIESLSIVPPENPPTTISSPTDALDVEQSSSTIRRIAIRASARGGFFGTVMQITIGRKADTVDNAATIFFVLQDWMNFLDPKAITHITLRHGEGSQFHEPSFLHFFQTEFPHLSHLQIGVPFSSPFSPSHDLCTEVLSAFLAKTNTLVSLSLAEDRILEPIGLSASPFSPASLSLIQELCCTPCQLRTLSDVPLRSLKHLRTLAISKSFQPDAQSGDHLVPPILRSIAARGRLERVKRVAYFSVGFNTGPLSRFENTSIYGSHDYGHAEVMSALGDLCPKATVVEGTFQVLDPTSVGKIQHSCVHTNNLNQNFYKDVFSPFPLAEEIVIYGRTREILRSIPAGKAALREFFENLTSVCPKARSFTLNKSMVDDGVDDYVFTLERDREGALVRVTEEAYEQLPV